LQKHDVSEPTKSQLRKLRFILHSKILIRRLFWFISSNFNVTICTAA